MAGDTGRVDKLFCADLAAIFLFHGLYSLGAAGHPTPPDELFFPRERLFRFPPAAGLSCGSHFDSSCVRYIVTGVHSSGGQLPEAGGELAVPGGGVGPSPTPLPLPVFPSFLL